MNNIKLENLRNSRKYSFSGSSILRYRIEDFGLLSEDFLNLEIQGISNCLFLTKYSKNKQNEK